MSGIGFVKIGDTVPIVYQLDDDVSDQYPQAEVRDDQGNLLTTYNLVYEAQGIYVPALPYSMPDEIFIKVTCICYTDAAHTIKSDMYGPGIDMFHKVTPRDYQADVSPLATTIQLNAVETNIRGADSDDLKVLSDQLDVAQVDLDTPNQYKADVSLLAIEGNVEGHVTNSLNAYDPPTKAELDLAETNIIAEVNENEGKLDTVIANIGLLHNLSIADVQTALTNQGYTNIRAVLLDYLDSNIAGIPALVDIVLTAVHGAGPWTTGSGGAVDWTSGEREQIRDALGVDGTKTAAIGGDLQDITTRIEATSDKDEILATQKIRNGVITDATPTSSEFDTDLTEAVDGFWNRGAIRFTSGQNEGLIRKVQQYYSGGRVKIRTDLPYVPGTGDTFTVIPIRSFRTNWADVTQIAEDVNTELTVNHGPGLWTSADIRFLEDMAGGRLLIDEINNQEIHFKSDNLTEVARFDLFDQNGIPAHESVYERKRV